MCPVDRDIARRKIERIQENLRLLEPLQDLTVEAYRADPFRRGAVERFLQVIVEAAVDINSHLLVETGHSAPDDQYSSFISAGQHGIIDDAIVLASVRVVLDLYPRYIAAVERFLSTNA